MVKNKYHKLIGDVPQRRDVDYKRNIEDVIPELVHTRTEKKEKPSQNMQINIVKYFTGCSFSDEEEDPHFIESDSQLPNYGDYTRVGKVMDHILELIVKTVMVIRDDTGERAETYFSPLVVFKNMVVYFYTPVQIINMLFMGVFNMIMLKHSMFKFDSVFLYIFDKIVGAKSEIEQNVSTALLTLFIRAMVAFFMAQTMTMAFALNISRPFTFLTRNKLKACPSQPKAHVKKENGKKNETRNRKNETHQNTRDDLYGPGVEKGVLRDRIYNSMNQEANLHEQGSNVGNKAHKEKREDTARADAENQHAPGKMFDSSKTKKEEPPLFSCYGRYDGLFPFMFYHVLPSLNQIVFYTFFCQAVAVSILYTFKIRFGLFIAQCMCNVVYGVIWQTYQYIIWYNKMRDRKKNKKMSVYKTIGQIEAVLTTEPQRERMYLDEGCPIMMPQTNDPSIKLPFFLLHMAMSISQLKRVEKVYLSGIFRHLILFTENLSNGPPRVQNNLPTRCIAKFSKWLNSGRSINKIRETVYETVLILKEIREKRALSNQNNDMVYTGIDNELAQFDVFYERNLPLYQSILKLLIVEMNLLEKIFEIKLGSIQMREAVEEIYSKDE